MNINVINTIKEAKDALRSLLRENVIGVDTEFYNNDDGGDFLGSLIQIATKNGPVYIFDVLKCPDILRSDDLKNLMQAEIICKVIHSCLNDSKLFWKNKNVGECHIELKNVFDTQGLWRVKEALSVETCIGHVKQIGYTKLCNECFPDQCHTIREQELKERVKKETKEATKACKEGDTTQTAPVLRRDADGSVPSWLQKYASTDVTFLIPLYDKLKGELENPQVKQLYTRLMNFSLYSKLENHEKQQSSEQDWNSLSWEPYPERNTRNRCRMARRSYTRSSMRSTRFRNETITLRPRGYSPPTRFERQQMGGYSERNRRLSEGFSPHRFQVDAGQFCRTPRYTQGRGMGQTRRGMRRGRRYSQ